jgi:V-type H+-transporting ATPase subunit F
MKECGRVAGHEIDKMQHVTQPPDAQKNFLVVDNKTETSTIEAAFDRFTQERKDIAILLINQHVCRRPIRLYSPHRFRTKRGRL